MIFSYIFNNIKPLNIEEIKLFLIIFMFSLNSVHTLRSVISTVYGVYPFKLPPTCRIYMKQSTVIIQRYCDFISALMFAARYTAVSHLQQVKSIKSPDKYSLLHR